VNILAFRAAGLTSTRCGSEQHRGPEKAISARPPRARCGAWIVTASRDVRNIPASHNGSGRAGTHAAAVSA
jgi:hypothetical protein